MSTRSPSETMHSSITSMPNAVGRVVDCVASGPKPLSAIVVFSNLISSSHEIRHNLSPNLNITQKMFPRSWSTGPHSLPTEVVQVIFQFVFESYIDVEDDINGDNSASWLDEDPLSPSLFPHSLACVCLRWFRILITTPRYWTRIVITLDSITTSLNAAHTTLQWVRHCTLKVIVTRYHGISESVDSERAGVDRAMEFIRPHINRIWSLSLDVEHDSSILALWRESGHARHLRMLILMSRTDIGRISQLPKWLSSRNSHEYKGKLEVPLLQDVTFSGRFFKNALMAHPRLVSWFRHITSLTICGDVAFGENDISLYKFLSLIDIFPSIRELTVKDIHFDDNGPYPNLLVLRPAVLCLCRITGTTALRGILTRARTETNLREVITIVNCTVHGFREPSPDSNIRFSSTNLTLASMDSREPIEDFVSRWNGERLSVVNCPRMSRSFIERLYGDAAPTSLSRLRIVDCNNFTAGDLISLVLSRETQAAFVSLMGGADDDSFTALVELCVQGCGPPVSTKRATWLAEHVEVFSWDTVAKDGLRYVWDGSTRRLVMFPANDLAERPPFGVKPEAVDRAR